MKNFSIRKFYFDFIIRHKTQKKLEHFQFNKWWNVVTLTGRYNLGAGTFSENPIMLMSCEENIKTFSITAIVGKCHTIAISWKNFSSSSFSSSFSGDFSFPFVGALRETYESTSYFLLFCTARTIGIIRKKLSEKSFKTLRM